MKLWLKQTLVTLAVILLSVSMCLYHFVAQETDQLIQQAIQSGARDTAVFATTCLRWNVHQPLMTWISSPGKR